MWEPVSDFAHQLRPASEHFVTTTISPNEQYEPFISVSKLIVGHLSCTGPDGTFEIFNPDTKFLSYCLIILIGAFNSVVYLLPTLFRTWDLSHHERGPKTRNGQLAFSASLLVLVFYLTSFVVGQYPPTRLEYVIIVGGFAIATLQGVQDGRVKVSSAEVLLYWLGMMGVFASFTLDRFLRNVEDSAIICLALATVLSVIVFILELHNPSRTAGLDMDHRSLDEVDIFSQISVSYADPILKKGVHEQLTKDDFPRAPPEMNSVNCYMKFTEALKTYKETFKHRILFALVKYLGLRFWLLVVLDVISEAVSYLTPSILGLFLHSLELYKQGGSPLFASFYYAVLLGIVPVITTSLNNAVSIMASYTFIMTRVAMTSLIYRKAMNLSPASREKFDSSKVMNLISVDSEQIDGMASQLPNLVSAPLGVIISTWQLWKFLGPSMFASLFLYGILVPLTGLISKHITTLYPKLMLIKDKRNKLTSNVFRSIKSLKLYAWELPYFERISKVRGLEELGALRTITLLFAAVGIIFNMMGDVVAVAIFTTYLYLGTGALTPGVIFPSLLLLQLATQPFMVLPMTITSVTRMLTSEERINELLLEKNHDRAHYYCQPEAAHGFEEPSVSIVDATVSWNGENEEQKIALKNISLTATSGDLVCVTGRVGSGKTALLKALGGELSILSGEITVKGSLAFCSQEAWLQNLTLRDNIMFGQKFDQEWYDRVVDACELRSDIAQMPDGDATFVGERGISLSGGQKARVALARAVYARADIYLFDDVLSAVDEHVSANLVKKVFSCEGLLANRTLILATNNVKVLKNASMIIELVDKMIAERATFREVVTRGADSKIYKLIEEFGHADDLKKEAHDIEERKPFVIAKQKADPNFFPPTHYAKPLEIAPVNIRLSGDDEEEKETETVSLSIFKKYFGVLPPWYTVFFFVILALSAVFTNFENIYLGFMSNKNLSNLYDARWYLAGYMGVVLLSAAGIVVSQLWINIVIGLRVSHTLHDRMLWNLMHAPITFFDSTPLGRLINRFTGEMAALDGQITSTLYYTIRSMMNVVVNLLSIVWGSPITIVVIIALAFLSNQFRLLYVPTSRKIARMASAANSPILSQIEESLKGQAILRTFDRTDQFNSVYEQRVDYWIRIAFLRQNLSLWLGYRIQLMSALLMIVSATSVTYTVSKDFISIGYCAVVIHFATRAGIMVRQMLSLLAQAEVTGVSLERILEYVNTVQEAPAHIEATEPPKSWPENGEVQLKELSARYTPDGPNVLKNLTCKINGGEKIGIVGRTGSGKSSLTLALFRMLEPNSGSIDIDNTNTSVIGLYDLRSRLSIIPQDAQIFDGTLRENLDPLGTSDDMRLWEVLDLCHLKQHFKNLDGGLDAPLSDGGENLSRGQAQLVCLGRALIHKTKILVLDEATASVDVETDRVVQQTIRQHFGDRTIITIAHRLNTIMDSDRIIVLDNGVIKEFDTPQRLLEAKGLFYRLYTTEKAEENETVVGDDA